MDAQPGELIKIGYDNAPSGLVGTLRVRVMQGTTTIFGPTTSGIVEIVAGSGSYEATFNAPGTPGRYRVLFDQGSISPTAASSDDLVVSATAAVTDTKTFGPDVRLPVGTSVALYQDNGLQAQLKGTPFGTALSSTTVGSDSKFTFSSLTPGQPYQAYALVGGANVWTTFVG